MCELVLYIHTCTHTPHLVVLRFEGPQCSWRAFLGDSAVKNLPAMRELQERQDRFPGQEDPLEAGMAPHPSILAWRIPWTEEPGGLQSTGSQRVRHSGSDLAYTHTLENVRLCV